VVDDGADARFRGPLAGMRAALGAAATPWVLTAPCDSPLLPPDYAARMLAALAGTEAVVSVAYGEGCWQPVFALLSVGLREDLAAWLAAGEGGVGRWLQRHQPVQVEFPNRPELFRNINTPVDLARLEAEWTSVTGMT